MLFHGSWTLTYDVVQIQTVYFMCLDLVDEIIELLVWLWLELVHIANYFTMHLMSCIIYINLKMQIFFYY